MGKKKLEEKVEILDNATHEEKVILEYCSKKIVEMYKSWLNQIKKSYE